jgi:hypothetical protein
MSKSNSVSSTRRNARMALLAVAIGAVFALQGAALAGGSGLAHAQDNHGSGHSGSGHAGSQKGDKGKGGKGSGMESGHRGSGGSSNVESKVLRDAAADEGGGPTSSDGRGPKYAGGKGSTGKPGAAGTKKGDLYGDIVVVLRDANGLPVLDEYGHVQPLDADGNLIPLTPEGDIETGYENLVVPVEFSRLSVSRSPSKVIEKSYDEAISTLNSADAITVDASGRLTVTIDGVTKTIDSPLENLALYETLMEKGFLPGLNLKDGVSLGDLSFLSDPSMTNADVLAAASFLAAASDKAGEISSDMVVYVNSFLKIDGQDALTGDDGKSYFDFTTTTYDRASTYDGTVTYLKSNGDGTYTTVTEPIMSVVFDGVDYSGTQLDAFTQAADDARAVIEFVHDHQIPED